MYRACEKYCDKVIYGNWEVFMRDEIDNDVIKWMQSQLTDEDYAYLAALPFL